MRLSNSVSAGVRLSVQRWFDEASQKQNYADELMNVFVLGQLLLVFVVGLMLGLRFLLFPVIADDTFQGTE